MREGRLKQLLAVTLISVGVFAGLGALRLAGVLQPLELLAYDLILSARSEPTSAGETPVVLVAVGEQDIARLGGWPMTDATLAELITAIDGYGARVIGLDIYRDVAVPPGTQELSATLSRLPSVVAIYKFASAGSPGVGPPPMLNDTRLGFSDVVLDSGGVVRRGLAFLDDGERFGTSFALRLALRYLVADGITLRADPDQPAYFRLGEATFVPIEAGHGGYVRADTRGYQFMVDFADLDAGFPRVSVSDVLEGRAPVEALADRIVIVGVDAVSVKDAFATPRGQWGWGVDPGTAGIALHGVVAEQFIRAASDGTAPVGSWSTALEYGVLLATCLIAGLVGLQSRSARRLLVIGTGGVLLAWWLAYLAFRAGVWIPVVPLATGWVIALALVTAYLVQRERHDRALLQRMFAAQTSKDVAETLWERRQELLDEGGFRPQTLTATVLFVDLGGFTRVSEMLSPGELMGWLHRFMEVATHQVVTHGGMVDDYFGDGLKANFGAPFARESEADIAADARAAARCALAIVAETATLNAEAGERPSYRARVGIHTGTVVVGGVGNDERQKYTSIGDTVNVAARLEGIGKELSISASGSIIISASAAALLDDEFFLHEHGEITLRGRAAPIRVFEVLDPATQEEQTHEKAQAH